MNQLILNYVLLIFFVGIFIREILRIKKTNVIRPFALITSLLASVLAIFSIIKGIPISDLQREIEMYFRK